VKGKNPSQAPDIEDGFSAEASRQAQGLQLGWRMVNPRYDDALAEIDGMEPVDLRDSLL